MVEHRPPKPGVVGSSPTSPAFFEIKKLKWKKVIMFNYFSSVKKEMKKVSWLSKNEILGSTFVVGLFWIIVALFLFIVDFGLTEVFSRILGGKWKKRLKKKS